MPVMANYSESQIKRIVELGNLWVSRDGSKQRVYFNDLTKRMQRAIGLRISYYNSGNVSSATINREPISNAEAKRYLESVPEKIWFDLGDENFYIQGGNTEIGRAIVADIKREIGIEVPA